MNLSCSCGGRRNMWEFRLPKYCKTSSTCSLPDEQYTHAICGAMGHDSRTYEYYRRVWYWGINALYGMKRWCAVIMSVTPLETCLLWYVWFWVDSDGTRPLYQSRLGSPSVQSWLIPGMFYTTMDNNTSWSTLGNSCLSAATAHPRPRMRRAARANRPRA